MTGTNDLSFARTIYYDTNHNVYYLGGAFEGTVVLNQNIMQQTMTALDGRDAFIGRFFDNSGAEFVRFANPNLDQIKVNADVHIYPNPASDNIVTCVKANEGISKISICDLTGKEVFIKCDFSGVMDAFLDVSHLQQGSYFVTVFTLNNKYRNKFVIVR